MWGRGSVVVGTVAVGVRHVGTATTVGVAVMSVGRPCVVHRVGERLEM